MLLSQTFRSVYGTGVSFIAKHIAVLQFSPMLAIVKTSSKSTGAMINFCITIGGIISLDSPFKCHMVSPKKDKILTICPSIQVGLLYAYRTNSSWG